MVISLSKKILHKKRINTLKSIIDKSVGLSYLPVVTDTTIQINSYKIEEQIDGFYVFDMASNNCVIVTSTKSAALAYVKNKLRKGNLHHTIKMLDYVIAKNKIDQIFYKQTLKKTKNEEQKFITQTRLQIAQQDIHMAKQELYGIIFDF